MAKYYEAYKTLLLASTLAGVYFPVVEKIYGENRSVKMLKLLGIVSGVSMPLYVLSALKFIIFDDDDAETKIYGCTMVIFFGFTSSAFYSFYYYRHDFVRVFELWDSMFLEELYPEDRQELLEENRKVTTKWFKVCGTAAVGSSFVYFSATYFLPDKKLNHPSGFPYRHQSPDFELLNTFDMVACCFGIASLVTLDTMTMVFLSMEEAQLRHLKYSMAKIVDTVSVTEAGNLLIGSEELAEGRSDASRIEKASEEVENKLRTWIRHHHQLLRFHDEFQKVFAVPLSCKFLFFVLIICFICFLTLTGKFSILEVVFSFTFCSTSYAVFYANVVYADSIADAAATIFGAAFEKSWYLYPKNLRSAFHIIQLNSCRPLQYLAFKKYSLSSSNFLKILSSAYSLFTFLLQTNRKRSK